jgi:hypothetical protein
LTPLAHDADLRPGKGQVDQGLVPDRLPELGRRALRPAGLGHDLGPPAVLAVDERPQLGDDPGRIAAGLSHIRKGELLGIPPEPGAQHVEAATGCGDERWFAAGQTPAHEVADTRHVVALIMVEQRVMVQAFSGPHAARAAKWDCISSGAKFPENPGSCESPGTTGSSYD